MIPYNFTDFNDEESQSSSQVNYPIETDDAFTLDQIEEINSYKERANSKISKNDSVLRGLETFFWGVSSYSLCKWLVLHLGSNGVSLAITVALAANQIVNRDCLDSFNLNRKDGQWEVDGMGKLLKFVFGLLASSFVIWASIGNYIGMVNDSKTTYSTLNNLVEQFNTYPKEEQNQLLTGGVVGAALVALVFIGVGVNKK